MVWHLYDSFLHTGGSYFGTQKSNEDVHIQFNYVDGSVWIVNNIYSIPQGSKFIANASVYDFAGVLLWSQQQTIQPISIGVDNSIPVGIVVPPVSQFNFSRSLFGDLRDTSVKNVLLRVELLNASMTLKPNQTYPILSLNDYWLSTQMDVLDWKNGDWWHVPCKQFADFTPLMQLTPLDLDVELSWGGNDYIAFNVTNLSPNVTAFLLHFRVYSLKTYTDIVPILWNDNFITLLPNETRAIVGKFPVHRTDEYELLGEMYNDYTNDPNESEENGVKVDLQPFLRRWKIEKKK